MTYVTKFRANDLNPSKGKQIEFNKGVVDTFFKFTADEATAEFECHSLADDAFKKTIKVSFKVSPARGDYKIYQNADGYSDLKDVFLQELHLTSAANGDDFYAIRDKGNGKYLLYYVPKSALFTKFFPVISGDQILFANTDRDGMPNSNEVRQLITYGAPGTGKSFKTKNETKGETMFRTTFHPDSDYATFVGAYKPTMKDDRVAYTEVSRKESSGAFGVVEKREQKFGICYKFVDQVFTKAYTAAWKYQKAASAGVAPKKVYLIIEEINRGNCAQIFGDLFQLLDRNPQGFSEYGVIPDADFGKHIGEELAKETSVIDPTRKSQIKALYPEIESGVDLVDEVLAGRMLLFSDNLYIRATMNTSDQSLFPMDSAFKRRWDWDYVAIKDHPEEEWEIEIDAATHYRWWDFLDVINKEIFKATSSEDKQLGYFFARTPNKKIDLNMFVNKVVFYLWNSVFKDCYTDCEFLKEDKDHYFTFTSFFNKGVIDPERAKKFLGKLKELQSKEAKVAASQNPTAAAGTDAAAATTDAGGENA